MPFASKTSVPVERSQSEIQKMLVRFGATAFASSWDQSKACVQFAYKAWHVRFELTLPDPNDRKFTHATAWRERPESIRKAVYDQEVRRLWRALVLIVKAKLEGIESGVETFEAAFLAHVVVPGANETLGNAVIPQLQAAIDGKKMPKMLSIGGGV